MANRTHVKKFAKRHSFGIGRGFALLLAAPALVLVAASVTLAATQSANCTARLTKFIATLDQELDRNPSSAGPLKALLLHHFPLKGCDVDAATKVSRQSKYFDLTYDLGEHKGIAFRSGRQLDALGWDVGFYISKTSGTASRPYAKPSDRRIVFPSMDYPVPLRGRETQR